MFEMRATCPMGFITLVLISVPISEDLFFCSYVHCALSFRKVMYTIL
jgi:hypothetical protein